MHCDDYGLLILGRNELDFMKMNDEAHFYLIENDFKLRNIKTPEVLQNRENIVLTYLDNILYCFCSKQERTYLLMYNFVTNEWKDIIRCPYFITSNLGQVYNG